MEELIIFWKVLLGICSTLATVWGAIKIMKEIKKPSEDLKEKVNQLQAQIEDIIEQMDDLEIKLQYYTDKKVGELNMVIKKMNDDIRGLKVSIDNNSHDMQLIMKSILAIGNHMVTGNDVEKIKDANQKIIDQLIEK